MNPILARLDSAAGLFGSRRKLAIAMGKSPDSMSSLFVKGSLPGSEFLSALWHVGISSDWLLTGEGTMYAYNEAGRLLQAKTSDNDPTKSNVQVLDNNQKLMRSPVMTIEEFGAMRMEQIKQAKRDVKNEETQIESNAELVQVEMSAIPIIDMNDVAAMRRLLSKIEQLQKAVAGAEKV